MAKPSRKPSARRRRERAPVAAKKPQDAIVVATPIPLELPSQMELLKVISDSYRFVVYVLKLTVSIEAGVEEPDEPFTDEKAREWGTKLAQYHQLYGSIP